MSPLPTLQFDGSGIDLSRNACSRPSAQSIRIDNAATISGQTDGAGSLIKTGAGTLTLSNANTYTGGSTISAGTLQLGNGGTSGSIVGNVTDNGILAFNHSNDLTFDGEISGTGGVAQIGTGRALLSANSPYTVVSAGTLVVGRIPAVRLRSEFFAWPGRRVAIARRHCR